VSATASDGGASGPPDWRPDRALGYIRLAAIPVIFAGERLVGLASCAERVEALEGRFEIRSSVARGTRVRAILPVAA